ncbi:MAG: N-acetylmuramoyl-L-alanine amidase [Acetobacterales bacterium]
MRERPSPNHDARPDGVPVDILLLHYTGMRSCGDAVDRLCDPLAKVSAHYVIDEDGTVWRLVAEDRRAWHAGVSCWHGARDINARSVGIELVNPGHEFGYRPFPEAQMAALEALAPEIVARHGIPPARILGHSDVAPARKQDPGELFEWARLARGGLGLWPATSFRPSDRAPACAPGERGGAVFELQLALAAIGYDVEGTGVFDPTTTTVVTAFQRHFRPSRVDGIADAETGALARHLAELA